jgi:hypothetical protein
MRLSSGRTRANDPSRSSIASVKVVWNQFMSMNKSKILHRVSIVGCLAPGPWLPLPLSIQYAKYPLGPDLDGGSSDETRPLERHSFHPDRVQ